MTLKRFLINKTQTVEKDMLYTHKTQFFILQSFSSLSFTQTKLK